MQEISQSPVFIFQTFPTRSIAFLDGSRTPFIVPSISSPNIELFAISTNYAKSGPRELFWVYRFVHYTVTPKLALNLNVNYEETSQRPVPQDKLGMLFFKILWRYERMIIWRVTVESGVSPHFPSRSRYRECVLLFQFMAFRDIEIRGKKYLWEFFTRCWLCAEVNIRCFRT